MLIISQFTCDAIINLFLLFKSYLEIIKIFEFFKVFSRYYMPIKNFFSRLEILYKTYYRLFRRYRD